MVLCYLKLKLFKAMHSGVHFVTAMHIPYTTPLNGKLTSEFTPQISNRKSWVFYLETLKTKPFPDWEPLVIVLCHIHQAQYTNTCSRSIIEILEQDVKHVQNWNEDISRRQWLRSGVFIVKFQHIPLLIL